MPLSDALNLAIAVVLGVWAVYQVRFNNRLERDLNRLNTELDQNIQRLYRLREALIRYQKAAIELNSWTWFEKTRGLKVDHEKIMLSYAETMASMAEMKGLAYSIDDNPLIELIDLPAPETLGQASTLLPADVEISERAIKIHKRISELIAEATKEKV